VLRARAARAAPAEWQGLMTKGMAQELSWAGPARSYEALYREALAAGRAIPAAQA
jgi:starch synthase